MNKSIIRHAAVILTSIALAGAPIFADTFNAAGSSGASSADTVLTGKVTYVNPSSSYVQLSAGDGTYIVRIYNATKIKNEDGSAALCSAADFKNGDVITVGADYSGTNCVDAVYVTK